MTLHPVTDEERKSVNPKRRSKRWTICELLRSIYILAEKRSDEETMKLSHDALCYAKRMNAKISDKEPKYGKEWWKKKEDKNSKYE